MGIVGRVFFFLLLFLSCTYAEVRQRDTSRVSSCPRAVQGQVQVIQVIPRKQLAFTQGLVYIDGHLVESTGNIVGSGRMGRSVINRIDPKTGAVEEWARTPGNEFGEGLAFLNGIFYQLTYTEGDVFIYHDRSGGSPEIEKQKYPLAGKQGWGLTSDGRVLIVSDGSHQLSFLNPSGLQYLRSLPVRDSEGHAYTLLNELEYVNGKVFANVFMSRRILRIDVSTGCVERFWDLSRLWNSFTAKEKKWISSDSNYVLNGIAYSPQDGTFYLTGKMWPKIFKVKFD